MNLIMMFQKIYMDLFSWAFDTEFDMDRTFNDLHSFHREALPESENQMQAMYAKIFKNKWFYLLSPILFVYLKFLAMKYTNQEYLQRMIEKDIEND
ncbi:hypothetical protein [Flavobacterium soli]|uniref:hypothetical protein n=1 Tax=Flavobacterium soli TaxID=344881 RepID=UPI0012FBBC85|nr:hypothetical protein [Flavobacterium soli]